jgi:flagellar motor protein MotB
MRTRRRTRQSDGEVNDPYWISFTDIMSALLLLFLLAVVLLMTQVTKQTQELADAKATVERQQERFTTQIDTLRAAEEVRAEILLEVQERLRQHGIAVTVSENNSVLSIPAEEIGFESGSYDVSEQHRANALLIGSTISDVIATDDRYAVLDTVFVEGHTDNVPTEGPQGSGNWGLSTFRAISLWRLWETDLSESARLDQFRSSAGAPLFSVSGYGETRPTNAQQITDEARAANRRIDIRFTVVRPTAEDLAEIVESTSAGTSADAPTTDGES